MVVSWSIFKDFVNERSLSIQWIDLNDTYWCKAIDGNFNLECSVFKNTSDATDFETNYKDSGNKSPKTEVVTQFEKDDKVLKLFCATATVDQNSEAALLILVPGTPGTGEGRYIAGGKAWFNTATDGDKIKTCEVVDVDNILGYGAGVVLKKWHDEEAPLANQGWYFPISNPILEVEPIGGYGFIYSGLYLRVTGKKANNLTTGTLYINLFWAVGE